jgi:flavin reductase (DIM6/NTAB) family NADH-FMN oxidoreductase RutF
MMEPTAQDFKQAMRGFVGACSLITMGLGAEASGLVVTSGISLTAEPPMVLACVNRASSGWPLLKRAGVFGWSALGAGDQGVAERFSGFGGLKGAARYEGAEWVTGQGGVRTLAGAPLAFDCAVEEMIDRGTHSIVIGRVLSIRTTPGMGALVYWNGAYRGLAA